MKDSLLPSGPAASTEQPQHSSIFENIPLAKEHVVFKLWIFDPTVKCSEIVASVNVEKVTPTIISTILTPLRDVMPCYGFEIGAATCDAAGCNWVSFRDMLSTHTFNDAMPRWIVEQFPLIDFNIKCLMRDHVAGRWVIFLPDMPHLTKNIVTCLEKSSSKVSKRELKYGGAWISLRLIEEIWTKTCGNSGQLQTTRLTMRHFVKDSYSRMNVALATQVLSGSVDDMISAAVKDENIVLRYAKGMYTHTATLCRNWNEVVDLCNGKIGPNTPANAVERQRRLLSILEYFSRWKSKHDERVIAGLATKYNFFADETWFCIRSLLLSHVTAIQIYCVENSESINPRTMNTDTVEWHFGNSRQMVPGSSNTLTAAGWDNAARKASAFNASKMALVGNNSSGENPFSRNKKF
jgi:hypothetical protein